MRMWKSVVILLLATALIGVFFVASMASEEAPPVVSHPNAATGADLEIKDFAISPATLAPRQPMTLTAVARNSGTTQIPGRRIRFYVNPVERPPTSQTPPLKEFVVGLPWPPNDEQMVEYAGFSLNLAGCDNVAYVWVDPLQLIAEVDETNNLKEIRFCVNYPGAPPDQPDAYEDDNVCDQAKQIVVDGSPQIRNFSDATDVDWVKFDAIQGTTYAIVAAGAGADAHPNLEIWDSCTRPPPGAFGSMARTQFTAPTSSTYYVRLENNSSVGSLATTTYEFIVQAQGGGGGPGPTPIPGPLPAVNAVQPGQGPNDRNTNVTITGVNFVRPTLAELCPFENSQCSTRGCVQVLDASYSAATGELFAIVQANTFAPGAYCVAVTNEGGRTGYLANAFVVQPGAPDPRRVFPNQTYADLPTDIIIFGYNFHPGLQLSLVNAATATSAPLRIMADTPLENVAVASRTQARGTVPANLPAGSYHLSAAYPGANAVILQDAYTVLLPTEDLFAQSQELWADPVTPRVGEAARLGVIVHRRGGVLPAAVLVRFSQGGSTLLGDAATPLLAPDSQASTEWLAWTPAQPGDYEIVARLDPNNQFYEASEVNNVVTRTVTVLPPAADQLPPRVDELWIGDGRSVVTSTQVYLNASATDYPLDNASGVANLRYVEFEYNPGNRLWIPVQDSNWLNYAQAQQNYRWILSAVSGNHYIQAWAKDHAGNVSTFPYQTGVDYMPPTDRIGRDQTRIYRRTLNAGHSLQVDVHPLSGDPDLYIWPPNWRDGVPPWVSNRTGSASDSQTIASAPISGVYQIEVYGYSAAEYTIAIQVNGAPALLKAGSASEIADEKPIPAAPLVDPNSEPPRNLASVTTSSPTPSRTPSPTPATPTPSVTPTASATPTPSATPTASATPTRAGRLYLPILTRR
jgi:hypothetical protein